MLGRVARYPAIRSAATTALAFGSVNTRYAIAPAKAARKTQPRNPIGLDRDFGMWRDAMRMLCGRKAKPTAGA